mmetsp:Transcript_25622/g.47783  ORF Transcript_25622/g.47783 Transcript_25622/m.47783 type:complete len:197 (+) Transcript_25622:395-985(+)
MRAHHRAMVASSSTPFVVVLISLDYFDPQFGMVVIFRVFSVIWRIYVRISTTPCGVYPRPFSFVSSFVWSYGDPSSAIGLGGRVASLDGTSGTSFMHAVRCPSIVSNGFGFYGFGGVGIRRRTPPYGDAKGLLLLRPCISSIVGGSSASLIAATMLFITTVDTTSSGLSSIALSTLLLVSLPSWYIRLHFVIFMGS